MTDTLTAAPKPKRQRVRETPEITKDLRRQIRNGLGRRAANGDLDALVELDALKGWIEEVIVESVGGAAGDDTRPGLRSAEGGAFSLTEIGLALGYPETSARQSAAYRFRTTKGVRRVGAQPAHLR
jgi:hypothetical protein